MTTAKDVSREEFEAWERSEGMGEDLLRRDEDGYYIARLTRTDWAAWQASRAAELFSRKYPRPDDHGRAAPADSQRSDETNLSEPKP